MQAFKTKLLERFLWPIMIVLLWLGPVMLVAAFVFLPIYCSNFSNNQAWVHFADFAFFSFLSWVGSVISVYILMTLCGFDERGF